MKQKTRKKKFSLFSLSCSAVERTDGSERKKKRMSDSRGRQRERERETMARSEKKKDERDTTEQIIAIVYSFIP